MTNIKYKYASSSVAIENLRKEGFTVDFNLEENCIMCAGNQYDIDDFEIAQVYRYEGASDPDDSTSVYGIESNDGVKGILLTSNNIYAETGPSLAILRKLALRDN